MAEVSLSRDTQLRMSEQSTTPDPAERWQAASQAYARRDLRAVMRWYAPEAVLENAEGLGTFEGKAAIRRFWQDWFASFDEFEIELEERLDLGNGVTFSVVIQKARLVGSSSEVRQRNGVVGEWADGLIVRMALYTDIDNARAAAERLAHERG
jgi:ketosteroid isomerase-like protein